MTTQESWQKHCPRTNPFLNYHFINALIQSKSIGHDSGWTPAFIEESFGILLSFVKEHSYGEYIFDWGWAQAYQEHGIAYYPKLTSMIPFTPVTTQHFLIHPFNEVYATRLLQAHDERFLKGNYSSSHFLFLSQEEIGVFKAQNYMIRESIQYHFFNQNYKNFEDFLSHLKSKKAKTIRREREFPEIQIKQFTGNDLTITHAKKMYQFYISTIEHKHSHDYLNEEFFEQIFLNLKEHILYVEATKDNQAIAASLFFYDEEKLYGRYWGTIADVSNLHFELCYYQGIDFCIKNNLAVFEAGAQGEHKIARGFRPVRTYSAHKIKHPAFKSAIENFIETEKRHVANSIEKLSEYLPFKSM